MKRLIAFLAASLFLVACGGSDASGALETRDAWARFTGANGAAYVTIENDTDADDVLLSAKASSDIAAMVEVHETTGGGSMPMGMKHVDSVAIPKGQTVNLQPGGYHIMFMDVKNAPAVGSTFDITLQFEKAGARTVNVAVRS